MTAAEGYMLQSLLILHVTADRYADKGSGTSALTIVRICIEDQRFAASCMIIVL